MPNVMEWELVGTRGNSWELVGTRKWLMVNGQLSIANENQPLVTVYWSLLTAYCLPFTGNWQLPTLHQSHYLAQRQGLTGLVRGRELRFSHLFPQLGRCPCYHLPI